MVVAIVKNDEWAPLPIIDKYDPEFLKTATQDPHAYIPLNIDNRRLSFPFVIDAAIGTFTGISFDPYAFKAMAVKGESLDKSRLFNEVREIAARDLAVYHMMSQIDEERISRLLTSYDMLHFKGDTNRYIADDVEANLFYWHLVKSLHDSSVVFGDGRKLLYDDEVSAKSYVPNVIEYGRKLEQILENVDDNEWIIVYDYDDDISFE